MIAEARKLSIGSLAYVMLPDEALFLRIHAGYREIQARLILKRNALLCHGLRTLCVVVVWSITK